MSQKMTEKELAKKILKDIEKDKRNTNNRPAVMDGDTRKMFEEFFKK